MLRASKLISERAFLVTATPIATVALFAVLWVRFWIVGDIDYHHPAPRARGGHFIAADDGLDMALVATLGMLVSLVTVAVAPRLRANRPLDLRARLAGLFALVAAGASTAPWISGHNWTEGGLAQRECVLGLVAAGLIAMVLCMQADGLLSTRHGRQLVALLASAAAAGAIWFDIFSVGDPDPAWEHVLADFFGQVPRAVAGIGLRVAQSAWIACALSQFVSWRGTRGYLDRMLRQRLLDIRRAPA
jgi:hypothetical protein